MQYALLIYGTEESGYDRLSKAELSQMYDEHSAYSAMLTERGALRGGMELADQARSVQHRPAGRVIVDGPYAESKEVLGGFYLVEAADLDEALEYARALPTLVGDTVEVRPAVEPAGPTGAAAGPTEPPAGPTEPPAEPSGSSTEPT